MDSIANRYSNSRPKKYERIAVKLLLKMLSRYEKRDAGSGELLCFGYHITGVKKINGDCPT